MTKKIFAKPIPKGDDNTKAEWLIQLKKGNKIMRIFRDEIGTDPREWDNLGNMVCLHKRYHLGDATDLKIDDFSGWSDMRDFIVREGAVVILPIYMYDHSGITISTTPFHCPWDSGQIGFIYATKDNIIKEKGKIKITMKVKEEVKKILLNEIDIYDKYLTGEVYSFFIVETKKCKCCGNISEENIDSCGGFFGTNFNNNGMFEHAGKEWRKIFNEVQK